MSDPAEEDHSENLVMARTVAVCSAGTGISIGSAVHGRQHTGRLPGVRVLLVEDGLHATIAMKVLLGMEHAEVTTAGNGREALVCLEQGTFDVVLSDIAMEVMDGHELALAVRQNPRWSTLPLLALSGFTSAADVRSALENGFDAHLSKPASLDQIVAAIRRLCVEGTVQASPI